MRFAAVLVSIALVACSHGSANDDGEGGVVLPSGDRARTMSSGAEGARGGGASGGSPASNGMSQADFAAACASGIGANGTCAAASFATQAPCSGAGS